MAKVKATPYHGVMVMDKMAPVTREELIAVYGPDRFKPVAKPK